MFKVSFSDESRAFVKIGKYTTCTLNGVMNIPYFWANMPKEICAWMDIQKMVHIYQYNERAHFVVRGAATCRPEDKYNPLLGERIAESRAKIRLYKFFYTLCVKLGTYYSTLLYGEDTYHDADKGIIKDLKKYRMLMNKEEDHIKDLLNSISHE